MTLQDLRSRLEALPADQPIVLNGDLVESEAIIALLHDCLQVDELAIAGAEVVASPAGDAVLIGGTAGLLNVEELRVAAEFSEDAGALQLRLTADLPDGWMFGDSFPDVAGYLSLDPLNYGYRESYLNVLDFARSRLVLTSAAYTDTGSEPAIELEPGLNFEARLSLTGLLEPLALALVAERLHERRTLLEKCCRLLVVHLQVGHFAQLALQDGYTGLVDLQRTSAITTLRVQAHQMLIGCLVQRVVAQ